MKTTMLLLVFLSAPLWAQVTGPTPSWSHWDLPFVAYTGNQVRGGTLTNVRQTDQVTGQAACFQGYFVKDYPNGWYCGGRIVAHNPYPGQCGPLNYSMQSYQQSFRSDRLYDHIHQSGLAWWVVVQPQDIEVYEACNLLGDNGLAGTSYTEIDTPAGCTPYAMN